MIFTEAMGRAKTFEELKTAYEQAGFDPYSAADMASIAFPQRTVLKFNPRQARDKNGRWTTGGGMTLTAAEAEGSGIFDYDYPDRANGEQGAEAVADRMWAEHGTKHLEGARVLLEENWVDEDPDPVGAKYLLEHRHEALASVMDMEYDGPSVSGIDQMDVKRPATGITWNGREWTETWRDPKTDPMIATKVEDLDRVRATYWYRRAGNHVATQWGIHTNRGVTGSLQEATADEFGIRDHTMSLTELEDITGTRKGVEDFGGITEHRQADGFLRAYARGQHAEIQAEFARRGISQIEVFRGVQHTEPPKPGTYNLRSRPLSSWTTQRHEAERFAGGAAGQYGFTKGERGAVLRQVVPVSKVWSVGGHGPGFPSSQEVVLLGGDNSTEVIPYMSSYQQELLSAGLLKALPTIAFPTVENEDWLRETK